MWSRPSVSRSLSWWERPFGAAMLRARRRGKALASGADETLGVAEAENALAWAFQALSGEQEAEARVLARRNRV